MFTKAISPLVVINRISLSLRQFSHEHRILERRSAMATQELQDPLQLRALRPPFLCAETCCTENDWLPSDGFDYALGATRCMRRPNLRRR
jgi:hypothetical protein